MIRNIFSQKRFTYIAFLITACVLALLLPNKGKFKYAYQKGQTWMYENLVSPIDFPILKSEEELRKERESLSKQVKPYFIFRNNVAAEQLRSLSSKRKASPDSTALFEQVVALMNDIYQRGILSAEQPANVSMDGTVVLLQGKDSYEYPVSEVFSKVTASEYLTQSVASVLGNGRETLLMNSWHLRDYLVPNLQFDEKTTLAAQGGALSEIALTKGRVYVGQTIIKKGEIVSAETAQVLDSFRVEYEHNHGFTGSLYWLLLGQFLAMLLCVIALYILIYLIHPAILQHRKRLLFILMQMPLILLTGICLDQINSGGLFMIPFTVSVLYMAAFFPSRIALPVYLLCLLPVALIAPKGMEWLFLNIGVGAVAVYVFHYWNRGWLQFLSAFVVFITYTLGYVAFRLIETGSMESVDWTFLQYFFWNALLTVAVYPVVYLLERLFGLVSESRLKDLADTSAPALQQLSSKAPGTMQHSLQVANMAEVAAREIGANALLTRVGALYHDLGKLNNPVYFIENQAGGINPHTQLLPQESAKIILQHVDDGMVLAKKYGLPKLVSDFILTHHGQARSDYFYNQYCNQGGDPENTADFTYRGVLPQTKEQVIVMIADAVEASTRSLTDTSQGNVSKMVDKMVHARLSEEQLVQANISFREIHRIKEIFKARLQEIYHFRPAYPERKES